MSLGAVTKSCRLRDARFIGVHTRLGDVIGIVVSEEDPASVRIGEQLLELAEWTEISLGPDSLEAYRSDEFELRKFAPLHLSLANVDEVFSTLDSLVFVSRHAGETGPLLSTHFPGNVGDAAYGGSPYELPPADTAALRVVFDRLADHAPSGYDVGIECTHHGPSALNTPCLFVEVGSGPDEWSDQAAAKAVAQAVLDIPQSRADPNHHTVVGIGGNHYAPRFERIMQDTSWRFGHIAADWGLAELAESAEQPAVIRAIFERSGTELAVFDGDRPGLRELIESMGYRVVSETWVRQADGVDLDLVAIVEQHLGAIDAGTRLGEQIEVDPHNVKVRTLPEELLSVVEGIDREAALEAIASVSTGYVTTEGGNRLEGSILIPSDADGQTITNALCPIIGQQFDILDISGGEIVLREERFDPSLARDLGVPDGPAFGKLARGESVLVDGKQIHSADVTRTVERRIPTMAP